MISLWSCSCRIYVIIFQTYTAQDTSRPVCFVFSGMGSQWPGMCKKLLEFENFRITIDACAAVLKTVDFDLYALFNSVDRKVFDNVLNSFVGITCAQVRILKSYCRDAYYCKLNFNNNWVLLICTFCWPWYLLNIWNIFRLLLWTCCMSWV